MPRIEDKKTTVDFDRSAKASVPASTPNIVKRIMVAISGAFDYLKNIFMSLIHTTFGKKEIKAKKPPEGEAAPTSSRVDATIKETESPIKPPTRSASPPATPPSREPTTASGTSVRADWSTLTYNPSTSGAATPPPSKPATPTPVRKIETWADLYYGSVNESSIQPQLTVKEPTRQPPAVSTENSGDRPIIPKKKEAPKITPEQIAEVAEGKGKFKTEAQEFDVDGKSVSYKRLLKSEIDRYEGKPDQKADFEGKILTWINEFELNGLETALAGLLYLELYSRFPDPVNKPNDRKSMLGRIAEDITQRISDVMVKYMYDNHLKTDEIVRGVNKSIREHNVPEEDNVLPQFIRGQYIMVGLEQESIDFLNVPDLKRHLDDIREGRWTTGERTFILKKYTEDQLVAIEDVLDKLFENALFKRALLAKKILER